MTIKSFAPAALCAVTLLAALILSSPWGNTPFLDDFSFSWMAKSIADTGHLVFNGWSEPTVGIQAYWGALIISIFGWSYENLRLSMFLWSAGCALLMYAHGRLIALSVRSACLGALIFCLSPLVLPLESSFMTEIPATFFVLLATYAAAQSGLSRYRSVAWLVLALAATIGGTSIRQSNVILLPVVLFVPVWNRREQIFLRWTAFWGALMGGATVWMISWFVAQPHAYSLHLVPALLDTVTHPAYTVFRIFVLLATIVVFCLPAFVASLRNLKPADLKFAGIGFIFSILYFLATRLWLHTLTLVPYGSIVTNRGILTDDTVLGGRPSVIPGRLMILVTFLSLMALAFAIRAAYRSASTAPRQFRIWAAVQGLFFILYFGGVIARTAAMQPFDRYLLPVLPFCILSSLYVTDTQVSSIPWLSYATLAVFAGFGIAAVHDYYAQRKICTEEADLLIRQGVKRTEITAGFDYDATTEIETAGVVMVDCLHDPGPLKKLNRFLTCAPSIHARYAIGLMTVPEFSLLPVGERSTPLWLPPFRATAKAFVVPPAYRQ